MKLRILHVVTSMNRGGLEVWLMNALRTIDRTRYQMDFLVQTSYRGLFDDDIRELGSRVIACPRGSNPWAFARGYLKALKKYGPYDVVHTHLHHFSGVVGVLSKLAGVRAVIAHSHNVVYGNRSNLKFLARAYLQFTESLIHHTAKAGLACSDEAGADLFARRWRKDHNRVLYCGVDFARFERGVPMQADVKKKIVHVGRFNTQKNHRFLLQVVSELAVIRRDFELLLVGTGPLESEIRDLAKELHIDDLVRFLGDRSDVPELLLTADAFVFPSLHEGLGLALVEAQAAGLPCVISDVIPREAVVIRDIVSSLSLSSNAREWAQRVNEILSSPVPDRAAALRRMRASPFDIEISTRELAQLYERLAH